MSGTDDIAIGTAERQALWAEWQRLSNEPAPTDHRAIGCMTVILVMALAGAGPPLARYAGIEFGQPLRTGAGIVLIVAFVAGILITLFLGSGKFARDSLRAQQALDWLAAHGSEADREERLRHTVSLLFHAYCSDGPSTTTTFNFDEAKQRLGSALPYVTAAERALRVDHQIYPVFTDSKVRLPG